uniref:Uncharacterized protein n=1 Tax=Anguilla anguilla TaxID=7936 RepID=A0A0E9PTE8_ANGAN
MFTEDKMKVSPASRIFTQDRTQINFGCKTSHDGHRPFLERK